MACLVCAPLALPGCGAVETASDLTAAPSGSANIPFNAGFGFTHTGSTGVAGGTGATLAENAFFTQIDSQGRVIVAGYANNASAGKQLAVWRFNANGTVDTSFGTGGAYVYGSAGLSGGLAAATVDDEAFGAIVDSSDRIVVNAWSKNSSGGKQAVVLRLTSAGVADTTFGGTGIVNFGSTGVAGGSGANVFDYGNAVKIDASGRIVLAGQSYNAAGVSGDSGRTEVAAWRYSAAGVLDTTFHGGSPGAAGGVTGSSGKLLDRANDLVIDASGRIILCGTSNGNVTTNKPQMALWRLTTLLALDVGFGASTGYVTTGTTGAAGGTGSFLNDQCLAMSLDANGKILAGGYSADSTGGRHAAVWRYTTGGVLDTSFGTGGVALSPVSGAGAAGGAAGGTTLADQASGLQVDSAGRIILVGRSKNTAGGVQMAIWRFNSDGSSDTTFGVGGYIVTGAGAGASGASQLDIAFDLKIDASGKYVISGQSTNAAGGIEMIIWRFNPDGTLDR